MLLTESNLPEATVLALRKFNILEVEQLLSLRKSPGRLHKLALALGLPEEKLESMLNRLDKDFPDLDVPAGTGRRYPVGQVPAKP
jgi:hypothetical protein